MLSGEIPIIKCPHCGRTTPDDYYCCLYCGILLHKDERDKFINHIFKGKTPSFEILKRHHQWCLNDDGISKKSQNDILKNFDNLTVEKILWMD